MQSQIYVPEMTKEMHIQQIEEFVWPFYNKIIPQFENIDIEADKYAEDYFERMTSRADPSGYFDSSIFADQAREKGITHYMMLKLGLYTVTASWHATLYEFFSQQLRLFLYNEVTHVFKINFKDFSQTIKDIKEIFEFHNFNTESLSCWKKIDELRLVCNVIKHGDGKSADELRSIAPIKFIKQDDLDLFLLYKTTLLEITINIDGTTLEEYKNALIQFWKEIPERSYSNDIAKTI